jgi:hypothetical protein
MLFLFNDFLLYFEYVCLEALLYLGKAQTTSLNFAVFS